MDGAVECSDLASDEVFECPQSFSEVPSEVVLSGGMRLSLRAIEIGDGAAAEVSNSFVAGCLLPAATAGVLR